MDMNVLVCDKCQIALCVGVQKHVMDNEIAKFGVLNFLKSS